MSQGQSIEEATVQLSPVTDTVPLPGQPDSKSRRYDRQLRLWAASGQNALESAHILVIGASPTSTSILKNLVLPGIGAFTIIDDALVDGKDLGANFFLESESLGKNRAEEAIKFLGELNDSVACHAETRALSDILDQDPSYLHKFTLIIAHNLEAKLLNRVSSLLWDPSKVGLVVEVDGVDRSPPLFVVRTSGFLSDFAIQLRELPLINTHSENAPSLRIDKPFPSLLAHAFSLNFDKMDVTDHGHIPYVVILVKALQEWKNDHAGNPPKTYAEKQEFKKGIAKMKKKDDEENFDEAVAKAFQATLISEVPSEVKALFEDPAAKNLTADSDPFWHLVHALQLYTSQPPYTLPLSSTLPDMRADTKSYIHLQLLYKAQAQEDKQRFIDILKGIEAGSAGGGSTSDSASTLALDMVDDFVKNAHALRLIRGKKRVGELDRDDVEKLKTEVHDEMKFEATATHLGLCAMTAFELKHGRLPKAGDAADLDEMKVWLKAKLKEAEYTPEPTDSQMKGTEDADEEEDTPKVLTFWDHVENAVGEVCRAPAAELPTTAAFVGGMVAQEVIKVITRQYVPVDGVCAVDLAVGKSGTIDM